MARTYIGSAPCSSFPVSAYSRLSSSAICVVTYRFPSMPRYQLHEPSSRCKPFSFSTAIRNSCSRMFRSNSRTICLRCSVSFIASASQGISSSSSPFKSAFCSSGLCVCSSSVPAASQTFHTSSMRGFKSTRCAARLCA